MGLFRREKLSEQAEAFLAACEDSQDVGMMERLLLRIAAKTRPAKFNDAVATAVSTAIASGKMPAKFGEEGFQFDPETLREFLEIILEFLPLFLEIILPLFS